MADELPTADPVVDVPQVAVVHDDATAQPSQPAETPQKDVVMSEAPIDQPAVRYKLSYSSTLSLGLFLCMPFLDELR